MSGNLFGQRDCWSKRSGHRPGDRGFLRGKGEKSSRCESGVAVLEFALIVPVLAFLMFGGMEVASIFMTQRQLLGAATSGARIGSIQGGTTTDVMAAITTSLAAASIGANFTTSISGVSSTADPSTAVVVTVAHNYPIFFKIPVIPNMNGGAIPLSATVTFRHD